MGHAAVPGGEERHARLVEGVDQGDEAARLVEVLRAEPGDLVDEEDVGEDRPRLEGEAALPASSPPSRVSSAPVM